MTSQLLATKLHIPPSRPDLVVRPRLINRLNEGRFSKLILVSAPAGFGKSTMISEWSRDLDQPVSWLSIDENDNFVSRFLTYLVAAFQVIDESVGQTILPTLEATDNPPVDPLITLLINEISVSENEFYVVLDDYHLITTKIIHDALGFLFEHLPPNAHLVVSGRIDPPFAVSRLRATGEMIEIRSADLRFTEPEVTAYFNELVGLDLSSEEILALLTRTEGWITGLHLAALSMRGRQDIAEFISAFSGSHHYIIDYLVDEVMARQPEEVQNFLCQSSIFDRFTANLCDSVFGISNSKQILQDLEDANLFLIPLDDERNWYRYHHMFSDFLNQRLGEAEPEEISKLHHRASEWFGAHHLITEAINHSLIGEDYSRAAQLVESVGPEMMMKNEFGQLTKWLGAIPQELVNAWPWLCIIQAWMNQRWARLDEAERYLKYAEQALEVETTPEPFGGANVIHGQAAAIRALIASSKTQLSQAVKYANQALEYLPVGHFNRSVAMLVLGMAKGANGDFLEAFQVLNEAYRDSMDAGNKILTQAILLTKGRVLEKQGRLHQALDTFKEAVQFVYSKTQIKIPYASEASDRIGILYREWNDLDNAFVNVEQGIEIGLQSQMVDAVAIGFAVQARIFLAMGNLDSAIEAIQNAERYVRDLPDLDSFTIAQILNSRAWVNISQNKFDEAVINFLETTPCDIDDINCFGEFEQTIWARILLHQGRHDQEKSKLLEAQGLINQMLELTEQLGLVSKKIELFVLKSLTLTELGNKVEALECLETALNLAEPEGYMRTFIDEGEPMKELLSQVELDENTKDYISKLLVAFDQVIPGEQPAVSQKLLEPLSDRELDVLKLLATDLSGPEIAQELFISYNTLGTHKKNIFSKLGVNNRRSAVRKAKDINLI